MVSRGLVLLYVFSFVVSLVSGTRKTRSVRKPVTVPRLNRRYLDGSFVVGPTSKGGDLRCQITFLKPAAGSEKILLQTAHAIKAKDGRWRRNIAPAGFANKFKQVGRTGAFKLQDVPVDVTVSIIKTGPVKFGKFVYIVLYDGKNYTTEISDLFLFNK